jgi:Mor family transcriptional regulator
MPLKKQKQNNIDVVFDFIEVLGNELEKKIGNHPTSKDMVRHLVERGIIETRRLRNYMVIVDFDRMLVTNKGSRTHTWMDLSIKYDISESQAQNIVYKERKKSIPSSNITY